MGRTAGIYSQSWRRGISTQKPRSLARQEEGNHEWCFYGWREGEAHQFYGPTNAVDVWPIKKVNPQNMVHLTEKPVELATRAMEYSSRPAARPAVKSADRGLRLEFNGFLPYLGGSGVEWGRAEVTLGARREE